MKFLFSLLFFSFTLLFPLSVLAETKEKVPPVQNDWDKGEDGDRTLSSTPSLLRDVNSVYVYSEKQLDNLTIGITDMQGNVYYEEVTTVPAGYIMPSLSNHFLSDSIISVFIKEVIM